MESYVTKLWGKISIPKVFLIKQGIFLFEFQNESSMRGILEDGPWFFGSRPLVLKPWTIDMDIEKLQDQKYPIWVQFPNLRLNLWSSTGISKIASLIGCPIATDKLTASRQRLSYARVLLEVDLPFKEPLLDQIEIQGPDGKSYHQKVVYEFKPRWCSFCNSVGHDSQHCRKHVQKRVWVPNKPVPSVSNEVREPVNKPSIVANEVREAVERGIFSDKDVVLNFQGSVAKESKNVLIDTAPVKHALLEKHAHNFHVSLHTGKTCTDFNQAKKVK
ncbi:uncharacterized protein LOC109835426 [Asparagus officinalis]|uniref:uncharacterized protein LOC109835426 n=1 Tax=Asparagus officinalis TaxID=4686 RepID=UPI00098DF825|nr:uncharacterized protein LOC109835426 [Asparagus officinalis]